MIFKINYIIKSIIKNGKNIKNYLIKIKWEDVFVLNKN